MTATGTAGVTLRPSTPHDRAHLLEVYSSTRVEELDQVEWPPGAREAFLEMQFAAQDHEYRRLNPHGSFDVIEVDGEPAGRLYVGRWEDEIRIIDIALLPEHRGTGVGTRLVRELLAEGARSGKPVSIHVEKHNRALRLYERLGFATVADRGVYLLLEATP
jgi:ribosomal protein S18 acetylase RimI-like enzyme